ncbi:hypothetical protein D3C80_924450 [compost metagenome]
MRDRRHRDAGRLGPVGLAQQAEQIGRRLAQVARRAQAPARITNAGAEAQQDFAILRRLRLDPHGGVGSVVQGQAAGRAVPLPAFFRQRSDHGLDLLTRYRAGTQQGYPPVQHRDDRALDPDRARPAVHGGADRMAGFLQSVVKGRRTGPSRTVGRGRDHGPAEGGDDRPRARMPRHAHGDAVQAGSGQITDPLAVPHRRHDGQWTGPEGLGQRPRPLVKHGDGLGVQGVGDVCNQGVEARSSLSLKDARHRLGVRGVGRQPIDGLGRQHDQPPGLQRLGGDFRGVALHGRRGIVGIMRCSTLSRLMN